MADDKRNRTDQPQGGDQNSDRQRQKDRRPGAGGSGGSMESPDRGDQNRTERDQEQE